jgi:phage FluMu protein Com
MAVAVEVLQDPITGVYELYEADERYRESLVTWRQLGALAWRGVAASEGYKGAELFARRDLMTALGEHLHTDREYHGLVDVEPTRTFEVRNHAIFAEDGRSMRQVLSKGIEYSSAASETDKRMLNQKARDEGDLAVLNIVESLRPGESYTVISMYPEEAMARDGKKYWEDLGYRTGVNYVQHYVKGRDGTVLTGTYSVENSDKHSWRVLLEAHGVVVPEDTPADDWIRHGIRQTLSPDEAKTFAADLRAEYYTRIGKMHRRYSVTEFLEERRGVIDAYFSAYFIPLARAIYSSQNEPVLQQFAGTLLENETIVSKLDPVARSELIRAANAPGFTAESGRLMERLIRYALVEELRGSLADLVSGRSPVASAAEAAIAVMTSSPESVNQRLSQSIAEGLSAGRTYGGCAKSIQAIQEETAQENERNLQDVFGGKGRKNEDNEAKLPDNIRCIKCRKVSPKAEVVGHKTWHCPKCNHEVDVCTGKTLREGTVERGLENRQTINHLLQMLGSLQLLKPRGA